LVAKQLDIKNNSRLVSTGWLFTACWAEPMNTKALLRLRNGICPAASVSGNFPQAVMVFALGLRNELVDF